MTREEYISRLKTALKNARQPSYDIHIICPECDTQATTNNGEWLIWCGDKEHAQALLDASRAYLSLLESKEWAIVPCTQTVDMYGIEEICAKDGELKAYKYLLDTAPTYPIGEE